MNRAVRIQAAAMLLLCGLLACRTVARAQSELLPVDHPATATLVRLYEFGGIPEFPREHLPVSRGYALRLLEQAGRDTTIPDLLRRQALYYRDELAAETGRLPTAAFIPTSDTSTLIYDHIGGDQPVVVLDYRDPALNTNMALEPVLDGDLRIDPDAHAKALIARGGLELRGTLLGHIGFSGRVTNGSVAGDSAIAARDPHINRDGSFGITGFGRDVSSGDGHIRADFDNVALELGHERVQLGGGLSGSLLLGSDLPVNFDYLRFSVRFGRVAFTHIHASLLGEATGDSHGPYAEIPSKYVAAHLLSFGPFAGLRFSIGESVIYHGRPFDLGYINPLVFMKTQEQYLLDRDNANLYLAMTWAPFRRALVEGEILVDDLRFSQIGKGFWNNKTAWRVALRTTAIGVDWLDAAVSYTRLEPYVFTHFNPLNDYTHAGAILGGGGLQPNSCLAELTLVATPAPWLHVQASAGFGEHGANTYGIDPVTGRDTVLVNVGGDVRQTHRAIVDNDHVTFLDGILEKSVHLRLEAEYELRRNVYLRIAALRDRTTVNGSSSPVTEIRCGLRLGAH
ncbi:MAG TPA: hypothetical protein VHI13_18410 [Candidatus Kapabacteria bacterium]|nr:hypothetical protein [Candidatus Kapabacteria bacterium]